jgi:hypothetical protein
MDEVSVYIPKQAILEQGSNFLEILKGVKPEEISKKQAAIERIASTLQYSVVSDLGQCYRANKLIHSV